jgi:hypothetical protein
MAGAPDGAPLTVAVRLAGGGQLAECSFPVGKRAKRRGNAVDPAGLGRAGAHARAGTREIKSRNLDQEEALFDSAGSGTFRDFGGCGKSITSNARAAGFLP